MPLEEKIAAFPAFLETYFKKAFIYQMLLLYLSETGIENSH